MGNYYVFCVCGRPQRWLDGGVLVVKRFPGASGDCVVVSPAGGYRLGAFHEGWLRHDDPQSWMLWDGSSEIVVDEDDLVGI